MAWDPEQSSFRPPVRIQVRLEDVEKVFVEPPKGQRKAWRFKHRPDAVDGDLVLFQGDDKRPFARATCAGVVSRRPPGGPVVYYVTWRHETLVKVKEIE